MTDEVLVHAARSGDEGAFAELFTRHQRKLMMVALRYRLSAQDAEDAVQQAMFKAWMRLQSFRCESSFSTWITRVLMNEVFQIQRRRTRMRLEEMEDARHLAAVLEAGSSLTRRPPSQEQQLLAKEQNQLLRDALRSLPESLRSVLLMQTFQEQSLEEIALQLKRPVATVKSRRHRARLELRKRIGQRMRPMNTSMALP